MSASDIVKRLVAESGKHPFDINCGGCEDFAWTVFDGFTDAFGSQTVQVHYGETMDEVFHGHVWTEYDGRHYDAEEPYGVSDPRLLPLFMRRVAGSKYPHLKRPKGAKLKPILPKR